MLERTVESRREEGVVDDERRPCTARDPGERVDVGEVHVAVFESDSTKRAFVAGRSATRTASRSHVSTRVTSMPLRASTSSSRKRVMMNTSSEATQWSLCTKQAEDGARDGRHARGAGDGGLRALERGDLPFERVRGRVLGARVEVGARLPRHGGVDDVLLALARLEGERQPSGRSASRARAWPDRPPLLRGWRARPAPPLSSALSMARLLSSCRFALSEGILPVPEGSHDHRAEDRCSRPSPCPPGYETGTVVSANAACSGTLEPCDACGARRDACRRSSSRRSPVAFQIARVNAVVGGRPPMLYADGLGRGCVQAACVRVEPHQRQLAVRAGVRRDLLLGLVERLPRSFTSSRRPPTASTPSTCQPRCGRLQEQLHRVVGREERPSLLGRADHPVRLGAGVVLAPVRVPLGGAGEPELRRLEVEPELLERGDVRARHLRAVLPVPGRDARLAREGSGGRGRRTR